MDVSDLVNAAMEEWDQETNCGETDPAFMGEVSEAIDDLVIKMVSENIDLVEPTATVKNIVPNSPYPIFNVGMDLGFRRVPTKEEPDEQGD